MRYAIFVAITALTGCGFLGIGEDELDCSDLEGKEVFPEQCISQIERPSD